MKFIHLVTLHLGIVHFNSRGTSKGSVPNINNCLISQIQGTQVILMMVNTYSSFLNPAENDFSSLQAAVKLCLSQPDFTDQLQIFRDKCYSLFVPDLHRVVDDKAVAAAAGDILEFVGRDALAAINRKKCSSCHRHSFTCLSSCKEDIFQFFWSFSIIFSTLLYALF